MSLCWVMTLDDLARDMDRIDDMQRGGLLSDGAAEALRVRIRERASAAIYRCPLCRDAGCESCVQDHEPPPGPRPWQR